MLSQPVCALSPYVCMLSDEATHTKAIIFSLTRWSVLKPIIYHTRGEHTNYYTIEAVTYGNHWFCIIYKSNMPIYYFLLVLISYRTRYDLITYWRKSQFFHWVSNVIISHNEIEEQDLYLIFVICLIQCRSLSSIKLQVVKDRLYFHTRLREVVHWKLNWPKQQYLIKVTIRF
jgi:HSP90 family molecular chaperone